jgi:tetratricopeptide (TPR) repeat protein
MYKLLNKIGRTTGFVMLLVMTSAGVQAASGEAGNRINSVEKLIESSSAARSITSSGNLSAIGLREQAQASLERARMALNAGDHAQANSLLDQATASMFEGVRILDQDQSLVSKHQHDYDARLESVMALCEAYDRISQEKGRGQGEDSDLYPIVHRKLDAAKVLRDEGNLAEGRKLLDEAYVAAKVGIEHLRGGDTLVRSLDFKSSEEEYDYELDRNDTHRMLVQVLLKEKMGADSSLETRVMKHMDKADAMRGRAESEAGAGRFEQAIKTLEESTREIVKAIRSSGVYIPG